MSDYTATREGFQRAMEWCLTGSPEDARTCAEAIATPSFYHVMNSERLAYDAYVNSLVEWRAKISDYRPHVDEFLRDGDRLAAHMTGTIKVDGVDTFFESFMFAGVNNADGRMEWMIERSVWGPVENKTAYGQQ